MTTRRVRLNDWLRHQENEEGLRVVLEVHDEGVGMGHAAEYSVIQLECEDG